MKKKYDFVVSQKKRKKKEKSKQINYLKLETA